MSAPKPCMADLALINGKVITVDEKFSYAEAVSVKDGRIQAIFDWEMATIGDPHDDLGWVCFAYYEVEGLIQGLMEKDWFIKRYEEVSGRKVDLETLKATLGKYLK